MRTRGPYIDGKRELWVVKEVTTGMGQQNIPIGTPKMAENRHGSKQARFGVQAWTKSNKIRMHRSAEQTSRSSRGIRIPRTTPRRPQLSLRGVRAGGGIPRGIPRRLSLPRPLLCLCEARVVLRRPRADREGSAGRLSSPSPRTVVAGFREPRELRGDSDWAGVWLGLRVRFGLVPTAKFYCSASLTRSKRAIKIPEKFLK